MNDNIKTDILNNSNHHSKARRIAFTSFLFALSIVLSFFENSIPSVFTFAPGIKLGLSNIIVMYALFFVNFRTAFEIAVLKAAFVFMTRGLVAAVLSLSGGVFSICIMILLMLIFSKKISYLMLSVFGALMHNISQYITVCLIYPGLNLIAYLPVLIIFGVISGIITFALLRVIMPILDKLKLN